MKRNIFILIAIALFVSSVGFSQEPVPARTSPLEMVTLKHEDTYIKITYGRPHKRGRVIFGSLVPYGEIWRTGANEATEITITKNIKINGKEVKAGTYSVFTIPQIDKWTVILNSELGQWGSYKYNEKLDVLRFDVPIQTNDKVYEPFTIEFHQDTKTTNILMLWDTTYVSIPVTFS